MACPSNGSSSFTFYRKDLFAKAGLTMPEHPTWDQIAGFAAKLNNPQQSMSGICLRGVPGWGQNLAALTTVINTFGGSWFDMNWAPQLTAPRPRLRFSSTSIFCASQGSPMPRATAGRNACSSSPRARPRCGTTTPSSPAR